MLEHRHRRFGGDSPDQPFAAARDDQVDELVEPQKLADGIAVRGGHQLHGIGGQIVGRQAILENPMEGAVGVQGFLAAAEHNGVAALDAQRGRVDGDVGPGFVNEEDDAERHGDLVDHQAVGPHAAVEDAADGIGQGGHLAQASRRGRDPVRRQPQTVLLGSSQLRGTWLGKVSGVGIEDFGAARLQSVGGGAQPSILALTGDGGQRACGSAGAGSEIVAVADEVHGPALKGVQCPK